MLTVVPWRRLAATHDAPRKPEIRAQRRDSDKHRDREAVPSDEREYALCDQKTWEKHGNRHGSQTDFPSPAARGGQGIAGDELWKPNDDQYAPKEDVCGATQASRADEEAGAATCTRPQDDDACSDKRLDRSHADEHPRGQITGQARQSISRWGSPIARRDARKQA